MKNIKLAVIATLGAAITSLATKAKGTELEKDVAALPDLLAKHTVELDGLDALVGTERAQATDIIKNLKVELQAALEIKESKTSKPVITIGNVKYQINHGAHPYSAQELADNLDFAKAILKIDGQQAITKL